ncbi:MAG: potassium-transporting ATPase subunit KdpA, partial [Alphaproteobacteria bacterium]|nr:potassium-transporting ATPase subunit KdpA [Alphaproteobacteria bacterium]
MTFNGWLQIAIFAVLVTATVKPLGLFMARVFAGERTFLTPALRPVERAIYTLCGVHEEQEQHWTVYTVAALFFGFASFLAVYALQRLQAVLPLNPHAMGAVSADSSFNTAVSFATNTDWQ